VDLPFHGESPGVQLHLDRILKLTKKEILRQGSPNQIYWRAIFKRKNVPQATVYKKKSFVCCNLQEKLSK
jgi:hypothetical protein